MDYFRCKRVWVTGATDGIGRAVAIALARQGARLVISGRREEELHKVKEECAALPTDVIVAAFDYTSVDQFAPYVQVAARGYGGIDVLINCAGVSQRSLVKDTQLEVVRELMEVNFFGPVRLVQAVLPAMLAQGSGHVVMVSSLAGLFGTAMRSGYAASKHALHGFFESMRAEVYGRGIAVTIVCPGYVSTKITLRSLTGDGSPYGIVDESVARGISPARCADAILDAVARRRNDVLIGGKEVYAAYLKRLVPDLFYRLIRTAKVV